MGIVFSEGCQLLVNAHSPVFGSGLNAVDSYLAAATLTAAQAKAAHNEAWKKAGLA